jgi:hypothetical protein
MIANVKIILTTDMLGTVPKNEEIYKDYIETKRPNGGKDEVDIQKEEEKGWTGFHSDDEGLFIFDYMIKGFLKHWGNVLKDTLGVKGLRSKIDDVVFISPRKIRPYRDGSVLTRPDGVCERPLRAMTMKGERVSLAKSDIINAGTMFDFKINLLELKGDNKVTEKIIKELLAHGKLLGLGQWRNSGAGSFEVVEYSTE